jgi:methylenetetrahydrofolate reductase (NADPH)
MANENSQLQARIESGRPLLLAELSPPRDGDPAPVREAARIYAGRVHALGVSDNRDGVSLSALAAASLVADEGVEPVLHMVTRDRNRIALLSDCLGARALGIPNLLVTTGTHQTLGPARAARNVFDIDSIQLLQALSDPAAFRAIAGSEALGEAGAFCLGGVATPFADPIEMQSMRLSKKVRAGARFLISQPVFDVVRFESFMAEITRRGLHERAAVIAGIRVLADAEQARTYAAARPRPMIPESVLQRLSTASGREAQRAAGIEIATETIERLAAVNGLRGFEIRADGGDEAALRVMENANLGND